MGVINMTKDSPAGSQLLMIDVDFTKELIPTILGNAYDRVGNFCCSKDFSRIYCKNASSWELVSVGGGGGGGGSYTAGNGIAIAEGVIRAKADNDTIKFTQDGTMYAKDTTYTAGANITISDQNVISSDSHMYLATYGTSTWQQIHDAYYAGKAVFCLHPSQNYLMMMIQEGPNNEFHFATAKAFGNITAYVNTSNHWGVRYYSLYEEAGNGISISRSDNVDSKATVSAKVDGTTIGFDGSGNLKALGGSYTAGTGIDITGGAISTKIDGSTITVNSSGQLQANGGGGATYTSGEGITVNNIDHTISLSRSMAFTSNNVETEVITESPDSGTMWQTKGETVDDTLRLNTGTIEFTLGTHANEVCEFQVEYITHNYITGEDGERWYGSNETILGYTIDKLKIETANNIIVIYAKPTGVSTWNQLDTFSITNLIVHYQGFFKNCTAVTVSTATGTMTDPVYPLPHDGRLDDCFDSPGYFKVGNKRVPIIDLTTQKQKIFDHTCVGISYDGTYSYIYDFYRDGYSLMCEDEKTPVNITINLDRSGDPITASFGMYDNTWFDPEEPDIIGSYDESATGHEMIYSVQFKAAWDYEKDGFMPKFICRGKSQNIVYETPDVEHAYHGPNGFFIRIPGRIDDLKKVGYIQEDQTGVYFQYETKAEEEFNTPSSDRDIAVSNEDNTLVAYEGFGRALNMFNNDHILTDGALIMRIDNKTHDAGEWIFEILNEYEEAIITLTHDEVATGKKIKAVYYTKDINGARIIVTDDSGDNHISNLFWCKRSEKCYFRLKYSETNKEDLYDIFDLINFTGLYEKQSTILTADAKTYGYVKIDDNTIKINSDGLIYATGGGGGSYIAGQGINIEENVISADDYRTPVLNIYDDEIMIDNRYYFKNENSDLTINIQSEYAGEMGNTISITPYINGMNLQSKSIMQTEESAITKLYIHPYVTEDDCANVALTIYYENGNTQEIVLALENDIVYTYFCLGFYFSGLSITAASVAEGKLIYNTSFITDLYYGAGINYDDNGYIKVNVDNDTIKVNTSGQIYAAGGGGGSYTAGQGIEIDDNTIKAKVDGTTISFNNSGELVASGGSGSDKILIVDYGDETITPEYIKAQHEAGKIIYCKYTLPDKKNDFNNELLRMMYIEEYADEETGENTISASFTSTSNSGRILWANLDTDKGWQQGSTIPQRCEFKDGLTTNYNADKRITEVRTLYASLVVPELVHSEEYWGMKDLYLSTTYGSGEIIFNTTNITSTYNKYILITTVSKNNNGSVYLESESTTKTIIAVKIKYYYDEEDEYNKVQLTVVTSDGEELIKTEVASFDDPIFIWSMHCQGQDASAAIFTPAASSRVIKYTSGELLPGDGLEFQSGSTVMQAKVDGTTISFNNNGELVATGSSSDDTFIAIYPTTSLASITTAYNAGKTIFCKYVSPLEPNTTCIMNLDYAGTNAEGNAYFEFSSVDTDKCLNCVSIDSYNGWGEIMHYQLLTAQEEDRIAKLEDRVKELTALVEKLTMTEEPETEEPKIKE